MRGLRLAAVAISLCTAPLGGAAQANAPEVVSYQGVLTLADGTAAPDGSYEITFRILDAPEAGNTLYQKTLFVGVKDGLYNVLLAEQDAGFSLAQVFTSGTQRFMEVEVESGPAVQGVSYPFELSPLQQIASVPYALSAPLPSTGEAWKPLSLLPPWTAYPGFNPPSYRKDLSGVVHLRGVVHGGTQNQPVAQLPSEYRPENPELHSCQSYDDPPVGLFVARCSIEWDGRILPFFDAAIHPTYLSVDAISFTAEH